MVNANVNVNVSVNVNVKSTLMLGNSAAQLIIVASQPSLSGCHCWSGTDKAASEQGKAASEACSDAAVQ